MPHTDTACLAAALLAFALALAASLSRSPLWPLACAIGCALLIRATLRQIAAERLATDLCAGEDASRMPLATTLAQLASMVGTIDHRLVRRHPVTGLPTREILFAAIAAESAGPGERLLGMIRLVDFDRLAAFDPAAANQALLSFADRLLGAVDSAHLLVQVDRDCFAIWFRSDLAAATAELRAILYVAGQDLALGAQLLVPVVEAGTARGEAGVEPGQLLVRANAALVRVGGPAAGDLAPATSPSVSDARERFRLEQDLALAIAREELTMVFQPVVDLAAGRLIGAEALLRWEHPELGPISPAHFIPIVEETGMSERYGMWTLNAACREAKRWQDEGLSGLRVAVNLSARQLHDDQLILKIERTLERQGLAPHALELELTETAAMARTARTADLFHALSAMGISLAIDDFGSGYSSLSYLKNLPFNKLKIDREFVSKVQDRRDSQAICKALIELGRGLDLVVLAEGVEDGKEVAMLRALGCSVFQGFHFSKPLGGTEFLRLARDPAWCAALVNPVHGQRARIEGRLSA